MGSASPSARLRRQEEESRALRAGRCFGVTLANRPRFCIVAAVMRADVSCEGVMSSREGQLRTTDRVPARSPMGGLDQRRGDVQVGRVWSGPSPNDMQVGGGVVSTIAERHARRSGGGRDHRRTTCRSVGGWAGPPPDDMQVEEGVVWTIDGRDGRRDRQVESRKPLVGWRSPPCSPCCGREVSAVPRPGGSGRGATC